MSRPSPFACVVLAAALVSLGCRGGVSQNHRRGLLFTGAAAVFMGAIYVGDGLTCDRSAGGTNDCDDDPATLARGGVLVGVGLALGALGLLLPPEPDAR